MLCAPLLWLKDIQHDSRTFPWPSSPPWCCDALLFFRWLFRGLWLLLNRQLSLWDFWAFRLARLLTLLLTCLPTTCLDGQQLILCLAAVLYWFILTETSFNDCGRLHVFGLFGRSLLLLWFLDDLIRKTKKVNWYFARFASTLSILCLLGLWRSGWEFTFLRWCLLWLGACFWCFASGCILGATRSHVRLHFRVFSISILFSFCLDSFVIYPIRVLFVLTNIRNLFIRLLSSIVLLFRLLLFILSVWFFVESLYKEINTLLIAFNSWNLFLTLILRLVS